MVTEIFVREGLKDKMGKLLALPNGIDRLRLDRGTHAESFREIRRVLSDAAISLMDTAGNRAVFFPCGSKNVQAEIFDGPFGADDDLKFRFIVNVPGVSVSTLPEPLAPATHDAAILALLPEAFLQAVAEKRGGVVVLKYGLPVTEGSRARVMRLKPDPTPSRRRISFPFILGGAIGGKEAKQVLRKEGVPAFLIDCSA